MKKSKILIVLILTAGLLAQTFNTGKNGVVVSASKLASDIGIQILKDGAIV